MLKIPYLVLKNRESSDPQTDPLYKYSYKFKISPAQLIVPC